MPENLFFPGATHLAHQAPDPERTRSRWRETHFLLLQLCRAIVPALSLARALENWPAISHGLSDPPRRRRLQSERLHDGLSNLS